jgi:hypothetical protein
MEHLISPLLFAEIELSIGEIKTPNSRRVEAKYRNELIPMRQRAHSRPVVIRSEAVEI